MRTILWLVSLCTTAFVLAACGGKTYDFPATGLTGGTNYPAANWTQTPRALVTAGNRQQSPTMLDSFNGYVPLSHLGVSSVTCGYEFTTPANTSFSFSIIGLLDGNDGGVVIQTGLSEPTPTSGQGAEAIFAEGMVLDGADLAYTGTWWQTGGDGLARMEVRGAVSHEEVLIFRVVSAQSTDVLAVRVKIGNSSDINFSGGGTSASGVVSRDTIYSSDERGFGLPAIAVSGDRYSVACYDNDPAQGRMRRWLQLDATSGSVSGGEATSVAPDPGIWRDQELAARDNVLAVAYTGNDAVQAEVSLDRGASFPITQVLDENSTSQFSGQRLVQIEIAPDYTIAVAYWRSTQSSGANQTELCVTEATPTGFDSNNTPTGYSFGTPWVVESIGGSVVPIVMDLEYSSGGDLAVGYGYNVINASAWQMDAYFKLAVRQASGAVVSQLVDTDSMAWSNDPSISLIGSGSTMQVFYAYDTSDGIHLIELDNGGTTRGNGFDISVPGAYLPSVHARLKNGLVVLDLLYLAQHDMGWSLKRSHWDDFENNLANPVASSLFEASTQSGGTPLPSGAPGKIVNSVGWMGYDAVSDGDKVAIALHTCAFDLYDGFGIAPPPPPSMYGSAAGSTVLLPGMTATVPAPDANDSNQLEVIVID